jgi:large subunit ribosomal protein L15
MQAHQLKPPKGATHARKRIGRGNASGHGTYSGRGLKGQKARAGNKPNRFFEGGQTPITRRLPRKRGFRNPFRVEFAPVNLAQLDRFADGAEVTPETLKEAGLLTNLRKPVKVLGTGEISRKLNVTAHRFSASAQQKIEAAGGSVTALTPGKSQEEREAKRARRAARKAKGKAAAPKPAAAEPKPEAEAGSEPEEAPAEKDESENGDGG